MYKQLLKQAAFVGLVVLMLFSGLAPMHSQILTGSVAGIVSDAGGAKVPNANVTIRNNATGDTRKVQTNSDGSFSAASLQPGVYAVSVSSTGFSVANVAGVQVEPGAAARVDVALQIGTQSEEVNVSAASVVLQTDSAEVRSELSTTQLSNLPIPAGRNYQSALILVPGITPPLNSNSVAANPGRGLIFQSDGAFGNTNNVRIDGATANNVWLPHVAAYSPGLEAIDSVSVITNSFDAQQGLAGGASVNVHVKSGGNQFHGSTFWYHTDNALQAKPFFLPNTFTRKPKFIQNNVGATIGGPALKDKLFFFFSFDGSYVNQIANILTTVPTDAMRSGNFSGSSNPIYDPSTGTPTGSGKTAFAGNVILPASQSAIALAIQSHIPHATLPGISNNYFATGAYKFNSSKYDTNVTYKATSRLNLTARLGLLEFYAFDAAAYGDNGVPVSSAGGRQGTSNGTVYNGTFSGVYVISPRFVFDGYFAATALPTFGQPINVDQNVGLSLGIPGTNGPTRLYGGWPQFAISNFSVVGNTSTPLAYDDQEYQMQPNFTWTHASHTIRFGTNVSRQIIRHGQPQLTGAGIFSFTGGGTTVAGGPSANAYNAYADFLLGRFSTGQAERLNSGILVGKTFIYSLFAQDQWIASDRVTLSYGLRWDYFPIGGRDGRGFARYNPANNTMQVCGVGSIPHDCGYNISKLGFSPSLGISFRLTPSLVMRVGGGINKDPYPLAYSRDLVQNFPEDVQVSIVSPNANTASYSLSTGLPSVTPIDISSGVVPVPNTYTVNSLPSNPKRDYVETWNLSLEKQWKGNFITEGRYVGSQQLQIASVFNTNAGTIGGGTASQPYNILFGRTAATNVIQPVGRNQYNAFQAHATKQFSAGYAVNVGYTFSKTFAYCCDNTAGETVSIQAPGYVGLNRALATFDRPYVLTVSGAGQLPFGKGKRFLSSGVASKLAGGWQINGVFESYSGTPFTISAAANSLNAPGSSQLADRVRPGACHGGSNYGGATQSYVDATCFAAVTAVRFGNAGFNSVRGPGVNNVNASVFRKFSVGERAAVEFRAEAFNLSNTPHFANPSNTSISNVTFNADHSVANLNGFGALSATNSRDQEGIDQRFFRLGFKASF